MSYPSYSLSTIATDNYAEEFRKTVAKSAAGRKTITIQLYKADGSSLGFSVVGLKNEQKDELGIYIQDIHPNGIAARSVFNFHLSLSLTFLCICTFEIASLNKQHSNTKFNIK